MSPKLPPWAQPTRPSSPPPEEPLFSRRAARALEVLQRGQTPIFSDVRHALLSAFHAEAGAAPEISRVLADLREDPSAVRSTTGLEAGELLIQASYTMRLAREVLEEAQWNCVAAYYTHRTALELRRRKLLALHDVLLEVRCQACWAPRGFQTACALEWARWRRRGRTNVEWAERYKVTPTTIARWRSGPGTERRDKPGIVRVLEVHLASAEGALAAPMCEAGLIP